MSGMYSNDEIMQFVSLVAEVSDPERIILFGSYAYGVPDDNSDIDLLVIKDGSDLTIDDETKYSVALFDARIQRRIKMKYDVLFKTDVQARSIANNGGACKDALEKGKVVYVR